MAVWRPHPPGSEGARASVEEHAVRGGEAARGPRPCWGRGRPGPRPRGARHEGGPLAGTRAGTPPTPALGGAARPEGGCGGERPALTPLRPPAPVPASPRGPGKLSAPRPPDTPTDTAGMPRAGCGRRRGFSSSSLGPAPAPRAPLPARDRQLCEARYSLTRVESGLQQGGEWQVAKSSCEPQWAWPSFTLLPLPVGLCNPKMWDTEAAPSGCQRQVLRPGKEHYIGVCRSSIQPLFPLPRLLLGTEPGQVQAL